MSRAAAKELRAIFKECGYVRRKSEAKYRKLGHTEYKKGSEVRLVLRTVAEVRRVRALLREAGLNPGKPFKKHTRHVQPIYGEASVEWFLRGLGSDSSRSGFAPDGHRRSRRSSTRSGNAA